MLLALFAKCSCYFYSQLEVGCERTGHFHSRLSEHCLRCFLFKLWVGKYLNFSQWQCCSYCFLPLFIHSIQSLFYPSVKFCVLTPLTVVEKLATKIKSFLKSYVQRKIVSQHYLCKLFLWTKLGCNSGRSQNREKIWLMALVVGWRIMEKFSVRTLMNKRNLLKQGIWCWCIWMREAGLKQESWVGAYSVLDYFFPPTYAMKAVNENIYSAKI